MEALKRWKFKPFTEDGKAIKAVADLTFNFKGRSKGSDAMNYESETSQRLWNHAGTGLRVQRHQPWIMVNSFKEDLDRAVNLTAGSSILRGRQHGASEITSLARGSVLSSVVGDEAHARSYQEQFGTVSARLPGPDGTGTDFPGTGASTILRSLQEQAELLEAGRRNCSRPWRTSSWTRH